MNKSGERRKRWAISDIEGLQVYLPEVDPGKYYDRRENEALKIAIVAWPALAQLMGLSMTDAQTGFAVSDAALGDAPS